MSENHSIDNALNSFTTISLRGLEGVNLLDRMEQKFVFRAEKLPALLNRLSEDYHVLEMNGVRQSQYETLYFDSHDYALYRMHHTGRANRYKLRIRKYLDSGLAFYELKKKNAKKRTIKERLISQEAIGEDISLAPFLKIAPDCIGKLTDCQLTLRVRYTRITLVRKTSPERLTIDTRLAFQHGGVNIRVPSLCIAEVKQERTNTSGFSVLMHQQHISPLRISKYCFGMMLTRPDLKRNNFKPKLRQIARIVNQKSTQIHTL